jgi:hypothetical protein
MTSAYFASYIDHSRPMPEVPRHMEFVSVLTGLAFN